MKTMEQAKQEPGSSSSLKNENLICAPDKSSGKIQKTKQLFIAQ